MDEILGILANGLGCGDSIKKCLLLRYSCRLLQYVAVEFETFLFKVFWIFQHSYDATNIFIQSLLSSIHITSQSSTIKHSPIH